MPKLKVKKCSYKDCSSTSNNTVDIQFFNFPKREERLEKWIHSCNNELLREKSNQTLSSTFHVCSLHFKYNDFNRKISPFKTKLTTCSVPIPHNELTTIDAIDCAIGEIPNCNENSKIIISASQISDLCNVGKRKNIPDHVSLEEFIPKREFSKTSPSLQKEISSSVKGLETLGVKKVNIQAIYKMVKKIKIKIKICSYKGCESDSTDKKKNFFHFPKCEERSKLWLESCNNEKLSKKTFRTLSAKYYVCSKHFFITDFTKIIPPYNTKLHPTSIPIKHKDAKRSNPESTTACKSTKPSATAKIKLKSFSKRRLISSIKKNFSGTGTLIIDDKEIAPEPTIHCKSLNLSRSPCATAEIKCNSTSKTVLSSLIKNDFCDRSSITNDKEITPEPTINCKTSNLSLSSCDTTDLKSTSTSKKNLSSTTEEKNFTIDIKNNSTSKRNLSSKTEEKNFSGTNLIIDDKEICPEPTIDCKSSDLRVLPCSTAGIKSTGNSTSKRKLSSLKNQHLSNGSLIIDANKEVGAKKQISINGSIRVKKDLCQSFASTKENTATQSSEPTKNVSQPNIGKPAYLVVDDKYLLPIVTHSVKSCSDKHEVKDGPSSASLSSTGSAKGRKRKRSIIQSRLSLPSGSKRIMAFEKEGIKGKRALVTGGGSGIGLGIALKLVQKGAKVFIMGRNREKLENAVKESGNKIESLQVDVSDWTLTREAVQKILPIQLLVNNAGINVLKPVHEATEDDFDTIINTNLKSAINLTQIVTQDLISRQLGGKVVNISSQGSSRALHNHLMYCSSKAALDMATKCFALELGPKKIRVNCVNPTVVLTELGREGWSDGTKGAAMLNRIPQGRFAEVEEVVNATIFLLSDKSDMVNGHCLAVDGGFLSS